MIKFGLMLSLLAASASAITFDCEFSNVAWAQVGAQYTCTATIEGFPAPILTNVTGNHLENRTNLDVTALTITEFNLEYGVPFDIEEFFPNLVVLSLSSVRLYRFRSQDISPFPGLRVLVLYNNRLDILNSDVFAANPQLEYISLSNNRIRSLGPNIFDPLPNLQVLRMNNNLCFNDSTGNGTDIFEFTWRASFSCPPTFEQTQNGIFNSETFQDLVGRIEELEERLAALAEPK